MQPAIERSVAANHRRFLLPWLGAAVASVALAGIGFGLLGDAPPGEELPPLAKALTAGGLAWCGILLLLRQRVLAPEGIAERVPAPDVEAVMRQILIGNLALWAAALVPSILGVAQILAGGDNRTHLLLCAASAWVLAMLMPAQAKVAALAEAALEAWARKGVGPA